MYKMQLLAAGIINYKFCAFYGKTFSILPGTKKE